MKGSDVMHCSGFACPQCAYFLHKKLSKMVFQHQRRSRLNVGCWNMRTLVEAEGNIATSLARPGSRGMTVDRKATLMVQELKKYRMNLTGISETKWFGQNVYNIDNYKILHSGRPIPDSGEMIERNEGVGIVLDPRTSEAWRGTGGVWKAVSSRVVLARMKLEGRCGERTTTPCYVSVVSVYAPTHRSSQEKKNEFYADLQQSLDGVHESDVLLLLGDFNARVGSSNKQAVDTCATWYGVRGCHGVGKMNESGKALLSSCALNDLVIMNTTFEKKDIHKHTWQHPGSKQWHCIDYIIMCRSQRKHCCDVSVLRSAECWTDHKLLRAQLKLQVPAKIPCATSRKRFAVSALQDETTRDRFNEAVSRAVEEDWCEEVHVGGE